MRDMDTIMMKSGSRLFLMIMKIQAVTDKDIPPVKS